MGGAVGAAPLCACVAPSPQPQPRCAIVPPRWRDRIFAYTTRVCARCQRGGQRARGAKGSAGTDCGVVEACVGETSGAPVATHPLDSKRPLRHQQSFIFRRGAQCILEGGGPRRAQRHGQFNGPFASPASSFILNGVGSPARRARTRTVPSGTATHKPPHSRPTRSLCLNWSSIPP